MRAWGREQRLRVGAQGCGARPVGVAAFGLVAEGPVAGGHAREMPERHLGIGPGQFGNEFAGERIEATFPVIDQQPERGAREALRARPDAVDRVGLRPRPDHPAVPDDHELLHPVGAGVALQIRDRLGEPRRVDALRLGRRRLPVPPGEGHPFVRSGPGPRPRDQSDGEDAPEDRSGSQFVSEHGGQPPGDGLIDLHNPAIQATLPATSWKRVTDRLAPPTEPPTARERSRGPGLCIRTDIRQKLVFPEERKRAEPGEEVHRISCFSNGAEVSRSGNVCHSWGISRMSNA